MNKNILVLIILTIIASVSYIAVLKRSTISMEGIVVRTSEDFYFVEGVDGPRSDLDAPKYWIARINSKKIEDDIDGLNWLNFEQGLPTEYAKVVVSGRVSGSGEYGRAGRSYPYQLKLTDITNR